MPARPGAHGRPISRPVGVAGRPVEGRRRPAAVCYPLTISDAFSRFHIRCEIVGDPDGDAVRSVLDSAFREFGLPTATG